MEMKDDHNGKPIKGRIKHPVQKIPNAINDAVNSIDHIKSPNRDQLTDIRERHESLQNAIADFNTIKEEELEAEGAKVEDSTTLTTSWDIAERQLEKLITSIGRTTRADALFKFILAYLREELANTSGDIYKYAQTVQDLTMLKGDRNFLATTIRIKVDDLLSKLYDYNDHRARRLKALLNDLFVLSFARIPLDIRNEEAKIEKRRLPLIRYTYLELLDGETREYLGDYIDINYNDLLLLFCSKDADGKDTNYMQYSLIDYVQYKKGITANAMTNVIIDLINRWRGYAQKPTRAAKKIAKEYGTELDSKSPHIYFTIGDILEALGNAKSDYYVQRQTSKRNAPEFRRALFTDHLTKNLEALKSRGSILGYKIPDAWQKPITNTVIYIYVEETQDWKARQQRLWDEIDKEKIDPNDDTTYNL